MVALLAIGLFLVFQISHLEDRIVNERQVFRPSVEWDRTIKGQVRRMHAEIETTNPSVAAQSFLLREQIRQLNADADAEDRGQ